MKWFYPLQSKAKKLIEELYEIIGYCNWQDVMSDRVYECWTVKRLSDGVVTQVIVVMFEENNFIQLYQNV